MTTSARNASFIVLATMLAPMRTVHAAPLVTIVVNTDSDVINTSNGDCTLREAITAANTNAGVDDCPAGVSGLDTIGFSVSTTITLGSSLPAVSEDLTIFAPPSGLTVNGNSLQVLTVNAGITLNLFNLTVANGNSSSGGGVYNSGAVNITNGTFSGNHATSGGGIYSTGAVNITNSTFSGNTAGEGGGIYIYYTGALTLTNSMFSTNSATYGGGIYNTGTQNIMDSTFSGNTAPGIYGSGAAIYINNAGAVTIITNSTFVANNAMGYGSSSGGGAVFNYATANIINSTFLGNSTPTYGGGISSWGPLDITNSTFSGNSAAGGGGISASGAYSTTLRNTIVASSPSGGNCSVGTITNGGSNIEDGNTCGWGSGDGSMSDTNPMLGLFTYNGGPTATFALLPGSPAINMANVLNCPVADQRGVYRLLDGKCDIGAHEATIWSLFLPLILR
jgi:CSLREA domain-containing protein